MKDQSKRKWLLHSHWVKAMQQASIIQCKAWLNLLALFASRICSSRCWSQTISESNQFSLFVVDLKQQQKKSTSFLGRQINLTDFVSSLRPPSDKSSGVNATQKRSKKKRSHAVIFCVEIQKLLFLAFPFLCHHLWVGKRNEFFLLPKKTRRTALCKNLCLPAQCVVLKTISTQDEKMSKHYM